MPAVYADYTYHRTPKTRYGIGPTRPRERPEHQHPHWDNDTLQLVRARPTREEDHQLIQKLAKAERGLRLIDQDNLREYYTQADNIALRRNQLGVRNLHSGNVVKAFRNFKEALRRDPTLALAHNNIGLLYLEIGEHDRARAHLDLAILRWCSCAVGNVPQGGRVPPLRIV